MDIPERDCAAGRGPGAGPGSPRRVGDAALEDGRFTDAMAMYLRALADRPELGRSLAARMAVVRRRWRAARPHGPLPRVAVCGWDLARNAAGRVHTLAGIYRSFASVEIIGCLFARHGMQTWAPLADMDLPLHVVHVKDEAHFLEQALQLVVDHPCDIVHLSKPRAPNLLIGVFYKLIWGARVFVDVDDEELAFVGAAPTRQAPHAPLWSEAIPEMRELDAAAWTRLAVQSIACFDAVTVSNPALQQRYGGVVIRHARDETRFRPSPARRRAARARLGIGPDKAVIVFCGTPRRHKGLVETRDAIASLGRTDTVFLIAGTFHDPDLKAELETRSGVDMLFLGDQPFDDLPDLLACGDICILLQDPLSAVARFQVPAKLSDALAMGLVVLLNDLPAVADVPGTGAVVEVTPDTLAARLSDVLADVDAWRHVRDAGRALFLREFSIGANAPRLKALVDAPTQPWLANRAQLAHIKSLLLGLPCPVPFGPMLDAVCREDQGVSVVILTLNAAGLMDQLLSSFFEVNSHPRVELIVIDHGSQDDTEAVVGRYGAQADVRFVARGANFSFSESCNLGARLARHARLLFLNNDIVYTDDVIPRALDRLSDPTVGLVGVRLDDVPDPAVPGAPRGVQHTGVRYRWNAQRGYRQPEQIRHQSLDEVSGLRDGRTPAVTGAAMFCRRDDFLQAGGFAEDYDYGLEDIDLCLRLHHLFGMGCWCINELSLQHLDGATRKPASGGARAESIARNHAIFRTRWADYIDRHFGDDWASSSMPTLQALIADDSFVRESIDRSGLFDRAYYLEHNDDVRHSEQDPLVHYCESGWKQLRNPAPGFDTWWYWFNRLDPRSEAINPLLHAALTRHTAGFEGRPRPRAPRSCAARLPGVRPRRVCLFAAYDRDGCIDDYLIDYLGELARHADVYVLADCELAAADLDRLRSVTRGAWAMPHGEYDFGSYARLANDLVGWATLRAYDEVILANDSVYLLRPLDDAFAAMDGKACHWWGMQATKGISATRGVPRNRFPEKISIDVVKHEMLGDFEQDYCYDFLIGSYFIVFRSDVIQGRELEKFLRTIAVQQNKQRVILKYEVGLTRLLIANGYVFDTFVDSLHPFHPVYSDSAFALIGEGFPFLKRYLLTQNHYQVPELWRWEERLGRLLPGLDLRPMRRNLRRLTDASDIYRKHHVTPEGVSVEPLDDDAFRELDRITPKDDRHWIFPVCAYDHSFSGNERALFEEVRRDPSIRKTVLYRSRYIDVDGANVQAFPLQSREGQQALVSARYAFVKHTPVRNIGYPLDARSHRLINLWHGIPLKRIGHASLDQRGNLERLHEQHRQCHAVICSSKTDRLAMAAAFYPKTYDDIWLTGLPRNDFVLNPEAQLPEDLQHDLRRLRAALAGRRLVLFAPTFRNDRLAGYYDFSAREKARLGAILAEQHAVLGIREHMANRESWYLDRLRGLPTLDLGTVHYPCMEMLYRETDILVSDYSSCQFDFLLTGRPVLSFVYDIAHYAASERGFFYDVDAVLPGPICVNADSLFSELSGLLGGNPVAPSRDYLAKRRQMFEHVDHRNSERVVRRIIQDSQEPS